MLAHHQIPVSLGQRVVKSKRFFVADFVAFALAGLPRDFSEWCHALVDMLDIVDLYIFDNDLTRTYYSYNAEHYNGNPCNEQYVPKVFSYLHNEESQGNWIYIRNEMRVSTTRDVAVCAELFAIRCHSSVVWKDFYFHF